MVLIRELNIVHSATVVVSSITPKFTGSILGVATQSKYNQIYVAMRSQFITKLPPSYHQAAIKLATFLARWWTLNSILSIYSIFSIYGTCGMLNAYSIYRIFWRWMPN